MIPKSGNRFSEKIMLHQGIGTMIRWKRIMACRCKIAAIGPGFA